MTKELLENDTGWICLEIRVLVRVPPKQICILKNTNTTDETNRIFSATFNTQ